MGADFISVRTLTKKFGAFTAVVTVEGVEVRAVQPSVGLVSGQSVAVTLLPEDCIVLSESHSAVALA